MTVRGEKEDSVIQASDQISPKILTYHKIGRQFELGITSVSRGRFKRHLGLLIDSGLTFVRAAESQSGRPDSVLMPAPVKTTIYCASHSHLAMV